MLSDRPHEFPYWAVAIPFGLFFLSIWLRSYRFTVSGSGYHLQRFWFGLRWFVCSFSVESPIGLEEDLFELGVTGIYVGDVSFGHGKYAEELLTRIKTVA